MKECLSDFSSNTSSYVAIGSILIANRGEIASRIIRSCRKMGVKSIVTYSDADSKLPFVSEADVSIHIGRSNPTDSYLNMNKIITAAKISGADAIHPGYGFLSENVSFARKCVEESIVFIGPHPDAIEAMGSKSHAKDLMLNYKIPIVPGYQGKGQSVEKLTQEAEKIGYPLLLKAAAGGGGKGMRIVHFKKNIKKAIEEAKRESQNAFGNDELIVEKYVANGRHIEIQIMGDKYGNVIHLLERECTIQRRYQKVIEESPSPVMSEVLRNEMGDAAVRVAKILNYDSAGTVEFIYNDKTGEYFFLEVNTRLQVEHPVTEEITGFDLVQLQIESAEGQTLKINQEDVKAKGYAIEVRLYAENVDQDFMPVSGKIERFEYPVVKGLRMETSIENGSEISVYYDPMIAKIIIWDETRLGAHRKMNYVLSNMICLGIKTNQDFLKKIINDKDFQVGNYNTHFIEKKGALLLDNKRKRHENALIAATLFDWSQRTENRGLLRSLPSGWRSSFYMPQQVEYIVDGMPVVVKYRKQGDTFHFNIAGEAKSVNLRECEGGKLTLEIERRMTTFTVVQNAKDVFVHDFESGVSTLKKRERFPEKEKEKVKGGYEAPMPSQVIKVLIKQGQKVKCGDGLVVLSSMKMENTIEALIDGVVAEVFIEEGQSVEAGFLLMKIGR